MNIKDRLYIATIGLDAVQAAKEYKIGLEIDEFCTAENMDEDNFLKYDTLAKEKIAIGSKHILHAPFNELFPSAIDPMARELAYNRFNQAYQIARGYHINRMVVHSGYVPFIYFKSWFLEKSEEFWQKFMYDKPEGFHIMIENVLEDEPNTLAKLIEGIGDKRVRACLDIGHAHYFSKMDLKEWIKVLGPWLGHVHLHNNNKISDSHWTLDKGDININRILEHLELHASNDVTFTLENLECKESLKWLSENGWLD